MTVITYYLFQKIIYHKLFIFLDQEMNFKKQIKPTQYKTTAPINSNNSNKLFLCACVCVCVCERERERERERETLKH